MPDQYESDTMRRIREENPKLFREEQPKSQPQTYTPPASEPREPKFNSPVGKMLAERYTDALANKWFKTHSKRISQETGGGEGYQARMNRLYERYPEVRRLQRERMSVE